MKEYELTVLVHPDLEADIDKPLKKVRDLIASTGGNIISEDSWGKKRLAYKIMNQDFAIYVHFCITLPSDAPLKISNALNITDEILRYLLVVADLKGRKALAEAKASESTRETSERE